MADETNKSILLPVDIEAEMRKSYLDYAMSVIIARALPDVRDGLKPVQRRILVAMNDLGLASNRGYRKCAKICGDTSGNYHPHGEAVIYPALVRLAQDKRIRVVGINYKDQAENARRFLGRYGDPFAANGADENGRAAIEWGVYGVPETFVVGRDAHIAFKLIGPITPENLDAVLKPEIEKAVAAGG